MELKRAGTGSWKGLCPFHAEKTPSFHVHEQRQFFYCFGCGEKGDVISFLTKIEQRSFIEVLRDLARQAGVDLPERQMTPAERQAMAQAESERERMLRAMEVAVSFYEAQLASGAGAAARAYLDSRGISAATSSRFRVGYAPAGWDALQRHLVAQKIDLDIAERVGLLGMGDKGRFDFFRDRVMLPVLDRQKRPVGFSSRLLDPEAKDRKYVNSPDSPLFHKKEVLYGLHAALDAIRRGGQVVVVEGNFDVLMLHEAGIEEAVAPMGTALTVEHVTTLGRMVPKVLVVFDGDEAGQRAARKIIPLFVQADVDGRIARLPAGLDPDDLVRQEGADAFRRIIETARPVVDQFIDDLSREARDASVPEQVQLLEKAAGLLAMVRNPTARELYAGRLPAMLHVTPEQVRRALRGALHAPGPVRPAAPAPQATPEAPVRRTPPRDELDAFLLLVTHPGLAAQPEAERILDLLVDPGVRHLYRVALESLRAAGRVDVPACLDAGPAEIREAVGSALMEGRYDGLETADRALRALRARLERGRLDAELVDLTRRHQEAVARGDQREAQALAVRAIELKQAKLGLANAPN